MKTDNKKPNQTKEDLEKREGHLIGKIRELRQELLQLRNKIKDFK